MLRTVDSIKVIQYLTITIISKMKKVNLIDCLIIRIILFLLILNNVRFILNIFFFINPNEI